MTKQLSDPLVPADLDLRDFGFMPLDVLRLRDSELAIESSAEVFRASVLLWCASWHQVPAGSLPNKDKTLSDYSRSGARWPRIRAEVLSRWVECSDGRIYNRVVAEKALEAKAAKDAQRARTKAATDAKTAKARAMQDQRDGQRNDAPDDARNGQRDDDRNGDRNDLQGKGREGKGQEGRERARGTRLPPDWELPQDWGDWAKQERPDLMPLTTADRFRDYWHGKPGKDGVKLDWQATWRNWVRGERAAPGQANGSHFPGRPDPHSTVAENARIEATQQYLARQAEAAANATPPPAAVLALRTKRAEAQ
jgi:uncharacterized protein YdaU (DUF1376 family)